MIVEIAYDIEKPEHFKIAESNSIQKMSQILYSGNLDVLSFLLFAVRIKNGKSAVWNMKITALHRERNVL